LKKGALVFIEGRIQSREWEKDGQKRTAVEIIASNFRMLGDKQAATSPAEVGDEDRF
jgi:single-strand DNA-binding protein